MITNLIFSLAQALLFAVISAPYYTLIPRLRDQRVPLWSIRKRKYPSDYPSVKSVCYRWAAWTAAVFTVIFSINYFGSLDVLSWPVIILETYFCSIAVGTFASVVIEEYAPSEATDYRLVLFVAESIAVFLFMPYLVG